MNDHAELGPLVLLFLTLSLFSVGGGIAAMIPEFHRQAVEVQGWMSAQQFADLFAISRAVPGPGLLIVPLIGFQVAGVAGAAAALLAFLVPAFSATYAAAAAYERFRDAAWTAVLQRGLLPISVGLLLASAFIIAETVDTSLPATALTAGAFALGMVSRVPLLIPLTIGALLGAFGFL
jgi:chromate transporter